MVRLKTIRTWKDAVEPSSSPERRVGRRARFEAIWSLYQETYGAVTAVVKVTGTAGKGSVCAMLEAALVRDGKQTGVFTSPHLVSPAERIRLNAVDVLEADLDETATAMAPFFYLIESRLGATCRPSFFEVLLLIAMRLFSDRKVAAAILETGVGGYNDVVSLIPGQFSCITAIGLDHVDELGSTVERVAADKAGIASENSTMVLGSAIPAGAVHAIEQDAASRGVRLVHALVHGRSRSFGFQGHEVWWETSAGPVEFKLPLAGNFQIDNLATVATLLDCMHRAGMVANPKRPGGRRGYQVDMQTGILARGAILGSRRRS